MAYKQAFYSVFKFPLLMLFCITAFSASSQSILRESLSSIGSSVSSSGITIQSSFGQASNTFSAYSDNGILRQGFIQPQTSAKFQPIVPNPLLIYPNPSNNLFFVQTQLNAGDFYTVTSITGAIVMKKTISIEGTIDEFTLEGMARGVYIFSLFKNNTLTNTNKIVLTQ